MFSDELLKTLAEDGGQSNGPPVIQASMLTTCSNDLYKVYEQKHYQNSCYCASWSFIALDKGGRTNLTAAGISRSSLGSYM